MDFIRISWFEHGPDNTLNCGTQWYQLTNEAVVELQIANDFEGFFLQPV